MTKTNKITNLDVVKKNSKNYSKVSSLSPREIVSELDELTFLLVEHALKINAQSTNTLIHKVFFANGIYFKKFTGE